MGIELQSTQHWPLLLALVFMMCRDNRDAQYVTSLPLASLDRMSKVWRWWHKKLLCFCLCRQQHADLSTLHTFLLTVGSKANTAVDQEHHRLHWWCTYCAGAVHILCMYTITTLSMCAATFCLLPV